MTNRRIVFFDTETNEFISDRVNKWIDELIADAILDVQQRLEITERLYAEVVERINTVNTVEVIPSADGLSGVIRISSVPPSYVGNIGVQVYPDTLVLLGAGVVADADGLTLTGANVYDDGDALVIL